MNARAGLKTNDGNGSPPSARDLVEQGQRIHEDVASLATAVRKMAHGWEALLRDRLERQPYATLAVAAGVGYVLGGGIPSGVLRLLVGVGGRLAVEQAIARLAAPSAADGS